MSIETENPKSVLEKVDALANAIEIMALAHAMKDTERFAQAKEKAAKWVFEIQQAIQDAVED